MGDKYEYKTKPFKHQLEALRESASKQNFAYFMEMGCVDGDTEFLTQRGWVKFGDFDQWIVRNIKESRIIGGETKQLYEIGPNAVWNENKPYTNQGGYP